MTEESGNTRNYTFGNNVESAQELDAIGAKVRDFIRTVGDGPCEIQVAINPALCEQATGDYVVGAPVIGFVHGGNDEDYYEEEDE